jgi:opacity protein-like surface antigen
MHKLFSYTIQFILCLQPVFLNASCWQGEIRGGYLWFQDKTLQKIYTGGLLIEGQVNYNVLPRYDIWGSVGLLERDGSSISFHEKTRVRLVPLGLGIKYNYPLKCSCPTNIYSGAGFQYTFLNIHNDSEFAKSHVSNHNLGLVAKMGIYFRPCSNLLIDLFINYSYTKHHFKDTEEDTVERFSINTGGVFLGVGLGYKF